MTERSTPNHCPYCGDENLWPREGGPGSWECRACLRAFDLKFAGLLSTPRQAGDAR